MSLEIYLAGYVVAFGYQLADSDFRIYDLIVCPLLWPATLIFQIGIFVLRMAAKNKSQSA